MTTSTTASAAARLRELADRLDTHPDVPVTVNLFLSCNPGDGGLTDDGRIAVVDDLAVTLGAGPAGLDPGDRRRYRTEYLPGPVGVLVYAYLTSPRAVCACGGVCTHETVTA